MAEERPEGDVGHRPAVDLVADVAGYHIRLKIDNPWLAGLLGVGALSLGAYYLSRKEFVENAVRSALAGLGDGVLAIRPSSILVELCRCHTKESFLSFLKAFEAKTVKQRLQKESLEIGFKDELEVTVTNSKEVYKNVNQIRHEILTKKAEDKGLFRKVAETCINKELQRLRHSAKVNQMLELTIVGNRRNSVGGAAYQALGDHKEAKDCFERALTISKEMGNKKQEAENCESLATLYLFFGEYIKAKDSFATALGLFRETGNLEKEFHCHCNLTLVNALDGMMEEAFSNLSASIGKYKDWRGFSIDTGDFDMSKKQIFPFWLLCALFCEVKDTQKALCASEVGLARPPMESMEGQMPALPNPWGYIKDVIKKEYFSTFVYISYSCQSLFFWVLKANREIAFRRQTGVVDEGSIHDFLASISDQLTLKEDSLIGYRLTEDTTFKGRGEGEEERELNLHLLYQMLIAPVADLLDSPQIIIVPDRTLYQIPFAALRDKSGNYLSETLRIRIVPSLMTLKRIQDSPADYHNQTGALIVGDPEVGKVRHKGYTKDIPRLPYAESEAEMIGELLGVQPLLGQCATKQAVLQVINSVSLVHFAAHGDTKSGEIFLAPLSTSTLPQEKDYLLTMSDISQVQLRAKLVVLSCCYSGRGHIKAEGVAGIVRAFLGSGARSVLVALWAIEDRATEDFMSCFYAHLCGKSASESLDEAMKWMRPSYPDLKKWAPFVLIGENVALDF